MPQLRPQKLLAEISRALSGWDYQVGSQGEHKFLKKLGVLHTFPCYGCCVIRHEPRRLEIELFTSLLDDWQLARKCPGLTLRRHYEYSFISKQQTRRCAQEAQEALQAWLNHDHQAELAKDATLELGLKYLNRHSDTLAQAARDGDDLAPYLRDVVGPTAPQLATFAAHHWLRPPSQEPDEVRDFLDGFRDPGALHSRGRFSLEAGRARKKLQAFQLLHPQEFVLHVVGAAVAEGAAEIHVHVDADEVIVDFLSPPLGKGDLESIFASLLSGDVTEHPGLPELAVALNAAAGLKPAQLYLEVPGQRFNVTSDQEVIVSSRRQQGHRFYFRAPLGFDVVKRFVEGMRGPRIEERLLEERCSHAPIPIVLNKKPLSHPLTAGCLNLQLLHSAVALWVEESDAEQRPSPMPFSAWLALGPPPELKVSIYGVAYEAPELSWKPLAAIHLAAPLLPRNLSRSQVTAGAEFRAVTKHLKEAQDALLERAHRLATQEERPDIVAALLRLAAQELLPEALQWPLLPIVGGEAKLSVERLRNERGLLFTRGDWTDPPRNSATVVRISGANQIPLQALVPGLILDSGDRLLAQARHYREQENLWLSQPSRSALVEGACLARLDCEFGQIALLDGVSEQLAPARAELLRQNRPLFVEEWDWLPSGMVVVLNHDGLEPDDDWTKALENEAWRDLQADARRSTPMLYRQLVDRLKTSPLARKYALEFLNRTLAKGSPFAAYSEDWRQQPLYLAPDGTLESHDRRFPRE